MHHKATPITKVHVFRALPQRTLIFLLILLANEQINGRIFIDNGAGKSRKLLDISSCDLSNQQKQALLGVHAFTGNDYLSSFLRKGKKICWKLVQDNQQFLTVFSNLGTSTQVSEQMIAGLSKYVMCATFMARKDDLS